MVFTVYRCKSAYVQGIGARESRGILFTVCRYRINTRIWVLYLQGIDAELTCVFGDFIYSVSVQELTYVCPVFNR